MSTATITPSKALAHVIQPSYIKVVLATGEDFSLAKDHPCFEKLKKALEAQRWSAVPGLVDLARSFYDQSFGKITIIAGRITYKGKPVHASLARATKSQIDTGGNIMPLMQFMDNLYQNPSQDSINELYDFMTRHGITITDDGHFVAYKAVTDNFMDCHTKTINNSPGQVIRMPRERVDGNRRNECSNGLHACAHSYLRSFTGQKVVEVKINPRDVVSVPMDYNCAKMRVAGYEVTRLLGAKDSLNNTPHADLKPHTVRELYAERKDLLKALLEVPTIKRNIAKGKIAQTTIEKATYGRLVKMMEPFLVAQPKPGQLAKNPLKEAREAAGLTLKQVAQALDISYKGAWAAENRAFPTVEMVERFMAAILELTGNNRASAISYPKPIKVVTLSNAKSNGSMFDKVAAVAKPVVEEEENDEDDIDEDDVY
jgi:transcriptional regulator with XRE-family HTH domain